jgi:hypothetical protein
MHPDVIPAQIAEPEVLDAEVLDAGATAAPLADALQRHFGSLRSEERTGASPRFAESVRQADDVMEAHLQEVFEHRLGALGAATSRPEDSTLDSEEAAAKAAQTVSASRGAIIHMLRSPHGMRNAIILTEILNPPAQRW